MGASDGATDGLDEHTNVKRRVLQQEKFDGEDVGKLSYLKEQASWTQP